MYKNNKKKKGKSRYERQLGLSSSSAASSSLSSRREGFQLEKKLSKEDEVVFGYKEYSWVENDGGCSSKRGWLLNMTETTVEVDGQEQAGLDLYFLSSDKEKFHSVFVYAPYFYVVLPDDSSSNNSSGVYQQYVDLLESQYESMGLVQAEVLTKTDLDQVNHLAPHHPGRPLLKLSFHTVPQLVAVRSDLQKNYINAAVDPLQLLTTLQELREYDVPYLVRVCMDCQIRAGTWYTVTIQPNTVTLSDPDVETKANPTILAFDIECSKAPLKFPDAAIDEIYMISYMVSNTVQDAQGYLIVSQSIVSGGDIPDFEYTPQPQYPGPFTIFHEPNELSLLQKFFHHICEIQPDIIVTYNGDFFDVPFLHQRAQHHSLHKQWKQLGFYSSSGSGEWRGRCCVHLDAFHWVQRDSYLPQGAQGLKAVTKYKLGYDPVEVHPEDMLRLAQQRPTHMATYSVSDAVATYYLYLKYVHMFIFSLSTIIPMGPQDVLRKGSGTLCEALLMVQAYQKDILCPNKHVDPLLKFEEGGHLLESETYIGGKVECLETGVYRNDLQYTFELKPSAFQFLIDNIDRDITFGVEVENGIDRNQITNYDKVKCEIVEALEMLRDRPNRVEQPLVYHLDVAAMYPNIILTNRLQPSSIVKDATCAACHYHNQSKHHCQYKLDWVWRGDYNPATYNEYIHVKEQLANHTSTTTTTEGGGGKKEEAALIRKRLSQYAKHAYGKTKITQEITKTDTVCMRENDFYVDTVRQFRDRRYDYKKLTKVWKNNIKKAKTQQDKKLAQDKELVYDSLQIAHKCILNSFYGYVMRKGARWRSMEMAGIVTKTGSDIITQARKLVEQIGRPLELDTDGIWCILPKSFPSVYTLKCKDGSSIRLEYPCVMLNADVQQHFTNHHYQTLVDKENGIYETKSECSIFFEVDGPYKCMVLPASTEEGRLLKKRYAVFDLDGRLSELKGFELKRRGELELIKTFQSQVFERFLDGSTLEECYASVANVANYWLDVLDSRGESLEEEELLDLISENKSMSKVLSDYGNQKGTSQTTARRLGDFLGADVLKDKGLNCQFIISAYPPGAPVTERAIPTAIWKAPPAVTAQYLQQWTQQSSVEIVDVLDWNYYKDRLGKTIQKIISIPAALQQISNPVPRIPHPTWLQQRITKQNDKYQQRTIISMFQTIDMEDMMTTSNKTKKRPMIHKFHKQSKLKSSITTIEEMEVTNDEKKNQEEEDEVENNDNKIVLSPATFDEWLKRKKQIWGKRRKQRSTKNKQTLGNQQSRQPTKAASSMQGYMQNATLAVNQLDWHIIEVRYMEHGECLAWVLMNNQVLQKINISVPRIFTVQCQDELQHDGTFDVTKVDRHLPHDTPSTPHLYQIVMPESTFINDTWKEHFHNPQVMQSFYEMKTPLLFRAILEMGCMSRLQSSTKKNGKSYQLSIIQRLEQQPQQYLNSQVSYKRIFIYETLHSKTGLIAVFIISNDGMSCTSHVWMVKPNSDTSSKKKKNNSNQSVINQNVSIKGSENIFEQLVHQLRTSAEEYSSLSEDTKCKIQKLHFVNTSKDAFQGVQDILNTLTNQGPTFLLLNTTKPIPHIRKAVPNVNSFPLVVLPFPPGGNHKHLPSLNWEPQAIQLCFEAYFYMVVVSYPTRILQSRYGQIPIGNMDKYAISTIYDVSLARQLQKSRALLWASPLPGMPDLGRLANNSTSSTSIDSNHTIMMDTHHIWGDEEETKSPVICNPGAYRSICIEIDVHNMAIAALVEKVSMPGSTSMEKKTKELLQNLSTNTPLGDEVCTAVALPVLRSLLLHWMDDQQQHQNPVADTVLEHFYRLTCNENSLLHDPALHRVLLSLMKSTFERLLGEFQRLGSTIVCATFHRIVIATNKTDLEDAREYIDFVISTLQKHGTSSFEGIAHLSLQPSNFYSHYLFLDEHNYGGIHFDVRSPEDEEESRWAFDMKLPSSRTDTNTTVDDSNIVTIVPTVVSGWNIMHYLASEISQEYFRMIVGRFSKDVYRKEVQIRKRIMSKQNNSFFVPQSKDNDINQDDGEEAEDDDNKIDVNKSPSEQLLSYQKKIISKHFSSYLTRAVAELIKDGGGADSFPELPGSHLRLTNPALEFVKNVMAVLSLDRSIDTEVHFLKKTLLTQVGVQEYCVSSEWKNPSASFILPTVFCMECNESRDIDLCVLPSPEDEEQDMRWVCDECQVPYDPNYIERRLVQIIDQKLVRYQFQDLRCVKTGKIAIRALSRQSECSERLKLDITPEEVVAELQILRNLARFYELDWLLETVQGALDSFKSIIHV